jgi:hypothetical protein
VEQKQHSIGSFLAFCFEIATGIVGEIEMTMKMKMTMSTMKPLLQMHFYLQNLVCLAWIWWCFVASFYRQKLNQTLVCDDDEDDDDDDDDDDNCDGVDDVDFDQLEYFFENV